MYIDLPDSSFFPLLEFSKLRFGDLPAGRERAKLSEVFGMRNFRIQHR